MISKTTTTMAALVALSASIAAGDPTRTLITKDGETTFVEPADEQVKEALTGVHESGLAAIKPKFAQ